MKHRLLLLFLLLCKMASSQVYDICVYGGTSAGVMAAYSAAKLNKKVILIEPGKHLGGLTSGGLGFTDIGNKYAITGLARNFYRRMGQHYGKFETWIFEPHVAEAIFNQYIKEANVPVLYNYRIVKADKKGTTLLKIDLEKANDFSAPASKTIEAKMFIDCSYEGDLMAKAGVSYTVGREDNSQYNESWNGVQLLDKHQFPDGISPYKIPADSTSGLLWGISQNKLLPNGTGNKQVQSYNFRICLTNNATNRIAIEKPKDYDSSWYDLLARLMAAQPNKRSIHDYLFFGSMPNGKTDINNNGGFSTDMIGGNYAYPDGNYKQREDIIKQHVLYTKGLLWFLSHDARVPDTIRAQMLTWGYPKDEYTDNNHFTPQLYIRESRRLVGDYVMTQANCEGRATVDDGVGMAAYTMDSHNCERLVVNGMVKNEGDVQKGGFGPYPVSYRALIPKQTDCGNLLVPVCLSASHIAYGSIRMEPVFMVLAQSCAMAASQAIDTKKSVQEIDVKQLQDAFLKKPLLDGSFPETLLDNDDAIHTRKTDKWDRKTWGGYGPSYLVARSTGTESTIQFVDTISATGNYTFYSYLPVIDSAATELHYRIRLSDKTDKEVIVAAPKKAEGQTSGEWVSLGNYSLRKNEKIKILLSSKNSNGNIPADAILIVPDQAKR